MHTYQNAWEAKCIHSFGMGDLCTTISMDLPEIVWYNANQENAKQFKFTRYHVICLVVDIENYLVFLLM